MSCLESILLPKKITPNIKLQIIRALRQSLNNQKFDAKDINQAINEGRE